MKSKILLFLFFGMLNLQAQSTKETAATDKQKTKKTEVTDGIFATIATNKGNIVLQLEFEKTPITVANFISLAEGKNTIVTDEKRKGKPFYDGLKFHRVIKDFMIQGGDPLGDGTGGPGYAFKDEFVDGLKFDKGGILAMANSGPTTNGSQFFITHKDTPWLDRKHTIFGHVTQGMEIVNLIAQDDVILKVTISRNGKLAKNFDAAKVFSEYYASKAEDAKKQALIDAENQKKYQVIIDAKAAYIASEKATATKTESGLSYKITQKGTGVKPTDGTSFNFNYAGYFENGQLLDSNYEEICIAYGKFNANRAEKNGYRPFTFQAGKKDGLIPGFLEGLNLLSYGDKAIVFIPSNLAYADKGAGGVVPPNTDLVFELEMIEIIADKKQE